MSKLLRWRWVSVMLVLFTSAWLWKTPPVQAAGPDESPARHEQLAAAYRTQELTFNNEAVQLAGTLVLPKSGAGPFPAVVMVHGSGAETRQSYWDSGEVEIFLQSGLAVFVYDKRGTGESGGDWRTASLQDLAADAVAAVKRLSSRPEIDAANIGLYGVSQGGWLMPLAAANAPQVAFVVNITGAAVPLANQEMWSVGNELRQRGFSEPALDSTMKSMHLLFSARPLLQSGRLPLGDLYIWFAALDPYLDPAELWAQVSQPAYVAYGAADALVPTADSVAVMQSVFADSRNPASRLVVYPDAGHGVRLPAGQWAPGHIQRVTEWMKSVSNGSPPQPVPEPDLINSGAQRWAGLGAAQTPWYATYGVQIGLMVFFAAVFGAGLLTALNPWAKLALPAMGNLPRAALLLASIVNLALLVGLLAVIAFLAFADANGSGPQVPYAGVLAALAGISVLLAIVLLIFAWSGWQSAVWSAWMRSLYILVAAAAAAYLPFLLYWNLLGPPL